MWRGVVWFGMRVMVQLGMLLCTDLERDHKLFPLKVTARSLCDLLAAGGVMIHRNK